MSVIDFAELESIRNARRATPEDAKMLSRLATRAVEEANAFGIHIDHKEGLRRARENLAFVKAMYGARRTEWSS